MADAAVAERTLPHNLEAERSVLGAILLHNDAFNTAVEAIDSNDFYRDAHRRIFDKMVTLAERGEAIDLVTLKEALNRAGDLDAVGGPAYISALVDGVPRSTNVEHYARIIKEKSILRSLIFATNKITAAAYDVPTLFAFPGKQPLLAKPSVQHIKLLEGGPIPWRLLR